MKPLTFKQCMEAGLLSLLLIVLVLPFVIIVSPLAGLGWIVIRLTRRFGRGDWFEDSDGEVSYER